MRTFLILPLVLFFFSCSKNNSPSKVQIDLSSHFGKLNSASGSEVEVLILNITGPGMNPVFVEAECKQQACTSISAEVPSGGNRLVQLLAVVSHSTGETTLFYGDQTAALVGGESTLSLALAQKGTFTQNSRCSNRG